MPDRRARSSRLHGRSFHHENSAWRQAHETLGGAADDLFIEPRMSHEPDDEQIEVLLVDECYYGLDRMTRKQMRLERHTGRLRLRPRRLEQRCQTMVCFGLFLIDLVDA